MELLDGLELPALSAQFKQEFERIGDLILHDPLDVGQVQVGAAYFPALDEMIAAGSGKGCWWNGRRASVSSVAALENACLCYTSSRSFSVQQRQEAWERPARLPYLPIISGELGRYSAC